MLQLAKVLEIIRIPQGKVFIKQTSSQVSEGLLQLDPGQEISGHNRPIFEELEQLMGESLIKIYDGTAVIMEKRLKPGDRYTIPWNKTHTHANEGLEPSILKWRFQGDAIDIVNLIRINYGS
ncbi:MAG: hypothetical protein ACD_52C00135G0010 [uncultured bacterium]|uniref:Cupin 2 conserved barrel domain-containing protein n=1 Tax=Candidatus Woesebacteria bacterium RIFCSPHIGHO2_12_FULL_41_24 TaxID=1802510 RepID=A0A1F8AUH3_9BACT|nr:MAG: hypothetical protein ACD_52C00135G0010 [uncultured bacterium]OGM55371.1 MAG: hypothetical protein A3E44_03755 [Candidatus Woesebacteria bacterium RIFCSPHIGHO2_12_FULL_41_24]